MVETVQSNTADLGLGATLLGRGFRTLLFALEHIIALLSRRTAGPRRTFAAKFGHAIPILLGQCLHCIGKVSVAVVTGLLAGFGDRGAAAAKCVNRGTTADCTPLIKHGQRVVGRRRRRRGQITVPNRRYDQTSD